MLVRLATAADGAACAAIYAPYVAETAISFEAEPPTAHEMAARIARTIERTPWVVVEVDGVVRAYAYGTRHRERAAYDWTVETTVYVDRDFGRRGLGSLAMGALLAILRLQGAHLAVAGITLPNPGSVGLHEALGFAPIGEFEAIGWKHGGWHGVAWYALELGPREPEPRPLVPLQDLVESAALEAALDQGQSTLPSSSG
jgi:phosphinothricin acetyltransferase